MTNDELRALNDALEAIETLSWHPQLDPNDGAELGEEELFGETERERSRIW